MGCSVQTMGWLQPGGADAGLYVQARRDTAFMPASRTPAQDTPTPSNDTVAFADGVITAKRLTVNISDLDGSPTVYVRYGVLGSALPGAPVTLGWIDDQRLICLGGAYSANGVAETAYMAGTSMATPHVAGAAALILSQRPGETAAALKADLLRAVDPLPSLKGKVATGGRLNVYKALATSSAGVHDGVLDVQALEGETNHFRITRAPTRASRPTTSRTHGRRTASARWRGRGSSRAPAARA